MVEPELHPALAALVDEAAACCHLPLAPLPPDGAELPLSIVKLHQPCAPDARPSKPCLKAPNKRKWSGTELADELDWHEEQLRLHHERMFCMPLPHHSGDGWVCRGRHWTKAAYPDADEHGPLGKQGPSWSASRVGLL